jgi:hypothetical protein
MASPTPRDESGRRPIDQTHPRDAEETPAGRRQPDERALGGADAVPDTPGVAAHGAQAGDERRRTPRGTPPKQPLAQVGAGKSSSMWLSIAGVVIVLILLAVMFF